jgi:hypothetical protein
MDLSFRTRDSAQVTPVAAVRPGWIPTGLGAAAARGVCNQGRDSGPLAPVGAYSASPRVGKSVLSAQRIKSSVVHSARAASIRRRCSAAAWCSAFHRHFSEQ